MLSGWGRWPVVPGHELLSEDLASLTRDANLTRGLGRSYGDASLPSTPTARVVNSRLADRVIAFDAESGVLHAEAGLTLRDINRMFLPRGWFVPVTPGTSFVTLGGAVASDVHGKNHHSAGTFGKHVRRLRLRVGAGEIVEASAEHEPDLFDATIGGMGLTGHMLDVEVGLRRVPSPWIAGETEYVPDLEALIARLLEAGRTWPYTLAWMDALGAGGRGRGVVYRGRWAEAEEAGGRQLVWPREIAFPMAAPSWALSPFGMRWFNELVVLGYGRGVKRSLMHPQAFFYPLDSLLDWNKAYGRLAAAWPMRTGGVRRAQGGLLAVRRVHALPEAAYRRGTLRTRTGVMLHLSLETVEAVRVCRAATPGVGWPPSSRQPFR